MISGELDETEIDLVNDAIDFLRRDAACALALGDEERARFVRSGEARRVAGIVTEGPRRGAARRSAQRATVAVVDFRARVEAEARNGGRKP